jgi:hypothetical protein
LKLVVDRSELLGARTSTFYVEYAEAIPTRECVWLFLFAGPHGEDVKKRFLRRLASAVVAPLQAEVVAEAQLKRG